VLDEDDAADVVEVEGEVVVEVVVAEGLELHPARTPRPANAATPKAKTLPLDVALRHPKSPAVPFIRQLPLISEPPVPKTADRQQIGRQGICDPGGVSFTLTAGPVCTQPPANTQHPLIDLTGCSKDDFF
jgi:hypothetical protein